MTAGRPRKYTTPEEMQGAISDLARDLASFHNKPFEEIYKDYFNSRYSTKEDVESLGVVFDK